MESHQDADAPEAPARPPILCVDDEPNNLDILEAQLSAHFTVHRAQSGPEALKFLETHEVAILMSDERMPEMSGIDLLAEASEKYPSMGRVILSAYGDAERILRALNHGHAHEYLIKPWRKKEVKTCLEAQYVAYQRRRELEVALERSERLERDLHPELEESAIVGAQGDLRPILNQAQKAAASDLSILILGETGTGKEVIARHIHEHSARAQKPFIRVNCAALSETLLESEMFGHEKGAFTGAHQMRRGRFELASGGTILLDEIGDTPPKLQVNLLRVLQERVIERVGGSTPIPVDIRVIASTHRDLEAMIREGTFREDLFYRLNVFPIQLPPLRERQNDFPALIQHLIAKHAPGHRSIALAPELIDTLKQYDWPGNIREFENAIQRALVLCNGQELTVDDFTMFFPGSIRDRAKQERETEQSNELELALTKTGGNVARAARELGIPRTTFINRAKKLGIL